jgi:hypothetical protein
VAQDSVSTRQLLTRLTDAYAPNLPEKLSEKGFEQRSKHEFGRYTEHDMGKREPFDRP